MAVPSTDPPADSGKAVGLTTVLATIGVVGACAACCAVPLAFPAVALAIIGGGVAFLGPMHKAVAVAVVVAMIAAWAWVWRQSRRTGKRPARATLRLLGAATALLTPALAWPFVQDLLLVLRR